MTLEPGKLPQSVPSDVVQSAVTPSAELTAKVAKGISGPISMEVHEKDLAALGKQLAEQHPPERLPPPPPPPAQESAAVSPKIPIQMEDPKSPYQAMPPPKTKSESPPQNPLRPPPSSLGPPPILGSVKLTPKPPSGTSPRHPFSDSAQVATSAAAQAPAKKPDELHDDSLPPRPPSGSASATLTLNADYQQIPPPKTQPKPAETASVKRALIGFAKLVGKAAILLPALVIAPFAYLSLTGSTVMGKATNLAVGKPKVGRPLTGLGKTSFEKMKDNFYANTFSGDLNAVCHGVAIVAKDTKEDARAIGALFSAIGKGIGSLVKNK